MKKFHAPLGGRVKKRPSGPGPSRPVRTRLEGPRPPTAAGGRRWVPPELGALVRVVGVKGDPRRYIVIECIPDPDGRSGWVVIMGPDGTHRCPAGSIRLD